MKAYPTMEIQLRHHFPSPNHLRRQLSAAVASPAAPLTVKSVLGGRTQELIQSGAVSPIAPKDAASAIESHGYALLDVRPQWEREMARVSGSLHVPLFVEDKDNSPLTLLKKWVHFGYIGLWTGQYFTTMNPGFVEQVEEIVPDKDGKILVACGEGLRSALAASKLHEKGYKNLGWLSGGFNRATDNDFRKVEGTEKLQYATIGGASYIFLKLLTALQSVGNVGNK